MKCKRLLAAFLTATILFCSSASSLSVYGSVEFPEFVPKDDTQVVEEPEAQEEEVVEEEPEEEPDPYAEQIEEINTKLSDLEKERQRIQASLSGVKEEKQAELEGRYVVDYQITLTQNEISLLRERISLLESQINEKEENIISLEEAINQKQADHDEHYADYLKRLRSMQVHGEGTMLGVLMAVDDYGDFLMASEQMSRMAEYDRALIAQMKQEREALEEEKEQLAYEKVKLEAGKVEVDNERTVVQQKQNELSVQQAEINSRIQDIEAMERAYQADMNNNSTLKKQMEAELENIYRQIQLSENPYAGGSMIWPLPGYSQISSYYGWRFGGSDYHTGIDITGGGVYGAPVVASNSGVVALTNWSYSPGRGYGIYVVIDHGGGMSTLYAHLSNIQVQTGQQVAQGQTIGNVGSTGWSTGPHLHFEIRENKVHKNPLNYL